MQIWAFTGQTGRYCSNSEGSPARSSRIATAPSHVSSATSLAAKQSMAQSNKPFPDLKSNEFQSLFIPKHCWDCTYHPFLSQGTSTTVGTQQSPSYTGHGMDSHGVCLCFAPVTPEQSLLQRTLGPSWAKLWFAIHRRKKCIFRVQHSQLHMSIKGKKHH